MPAGSFLNSIIRTAGGDNGSLKNKGSQHHPQMKAMRSTETLSLYYIVYVPACQRVFICDCLSVFCGFPPPINMHGILKYKEYSGWKTK